MTRKLPDGFLPIPRSDKGKRKWDGLSEQQEAYLGWLTDPEKLGAANKSEFATVIGVNRVTLSRWEKLDYFRAEWDKRLKELNVGPERIQKLMDRTYEIAEATPLPGGRGTGDQLKAIELYMKMVERISPQKIVIEDRSAQELSDDELAAKLRKHVAILEGAEAE